MELSSNKKFTSARKQAKQPISENKKLKKRKKKALTRYSTEVSCTNESNDIQLWNVNHKEPVTYEWILRFFFFQSQKPVYNQRRNYRKNFKQNIGTLECWSEKKT